MADKDTLKTLARNVKANPDDSFSKFALALEFLKQDKLRRAKVMFEDIHRHDPDYVGVYYHLGKLYERLGEPKEAKEIYEQGIDIAERQKEKRTLKELREALTAIKMEIEAQ